MTKKFGKCKLVILNDVFVDVAVVDLEVPSYQGALATTTGTATATRTFCKNINSRYCDHVATVQAF